MDASPTPESAIRCYRNGGSVRVWKILVIGVGVISVGGSLTAHSFALTFCMLFGTIAIGYLGYWVLSKNCYFISTSKAGFKDVFQEREVEFDEVRSVTRSTGNNYCELIFECDAGTVKMPLDPFDETWFLEVKAELLKRGISVSSTAYGFAMKED